MRKILLAVWFLAVSAQAILAEESRPPAGYVIAVDLRGADREMGTAIVRAGEELKPKIWMPLFAGDVVFVRDAASRVTLDMGEGGRIEVGDGLTRFEAKGEIETGDDAWSVITKIGGILAGGGDSVVPTNLISKGDGRLTPLAADSGPNLILRDGPPVLVPWKGGEAPFRIAVEVDGKQSELGEAAVRHFELAVPREASKRFDAIVTDAKGEQRRIPLQLRNGLPEAPTALSAAGPSDEFDAILLAGWLAERPRGAWRLEAMRRLNALKGKSEAATQLLAALSGSPR